MQHSLRRLDGAVDLTARGLKARNSLGGGEVVVDILDISASAHHLVEKVPYVVSRES